MANWVRTIRGVVDLDSGNGVEAIPSGSAWSVTAYALAGTGPTGMGAAVLRTGIAVEADAIAVARDVAANQITP